MMRPLLLKNTIQFKDWKCEVHINSYHAEGFAITLTDADDGSPIATVTRWFKGIPEYCVALDINNCGREIIQLLKDSEIIADKDFVAVIPSGFCDYPVYKLHTDVINLLKGPSETLINQLKPNHIK